MSYISRIWSLTLPAHKITLAGEGPPKTEDAFPDERATFMPALKVHARSHCCPRGGTLVTLAYIRKLLTVEIYSQLNRVREESGGNDDVSIVRARKYEMVRMT